MGKVYVAAFLLPANARKHLGEDGWEFDSPGRLPERVIEVLCSKFNVRYEESSLGFDVFEGSGLKLLAERDDLGRLESVFVQLRDRRPDELRDALVSAGLASVEVFVPVG